MAGWKPAPRQCPALPRQCGYTLQAGYARITLADLRKLRYNKVADPI
jgi:hypothetical protein